jgi:hypothetical protein
MQANPFDPEQFRVRESSSEPVMPFEQEAAVAAFWRALTGLAAT